LAYVRHDRRGHWRDERDEDEEFAPRVEVQVRVVSADPGAPMRLTRFSASPSAGWASWLPTLRGLKPGRWGKAHAGVLSNGKQYN
jgi:hypothetical protein